MGWTSYLEDIVNRYNNEFKSVRRRVSKKRKSGKSRSTLKKENQHLEYKLKKEKHHLEYEVERTELLGLYIRCKNILSEIKSALELAANSEIDLAGELMEASQAISHLRLSLKKARKEKEEMTKTNLMTKLAKQNNILSLAEVKIEGFAVENQRLVTENQRLESENQELKKFFNQIRSGTPLKDLKPTEKSLELNKNHQLLIYKSNKQNPEKRKGRY